MYIFWLLTTVLLVIFIRLLYIRYAPILNVPCIDAYPSHTDTIMLDIRDYQEAANDRMAGEEVVEIPIPYLRRYYKEIPAGSLLIIASNHLEKNLAIRFLKSKGFSIHGYYLTTCKCRNSAGNYI